MKEAEAFLRFIVKSIGPKVALPFIYKRFLSKTTELFKNFIYDWSYFLFKKQLLTKNPLFFFFLKKVVLHLLIH